MKRILIACLLALLPARAWAASGATTINVEDAGAATRTVNVYSSTGAVTGLLSWMNTICDFTTLTTCATVDSGHGVTITGEGTAGTPAGGVVSVQGVASGTALPASQSGTWNITNVSGTVSLPTGAATAANQPTNASQASTTSGQTGLLIQCAVTTSAPSYTTAQTDPLSCDTGGLTRVRIDGGSAINSNGSATPANSSPVVNAQTTPKLLNALSNSAVAVKASAGQLVMLQCGNTNTSEEYVQIYNIASASVTVGTSTPLLSIPIAASATGGFAFPGGVQFGTAISVAATTTATGGSAPSTALDCNAAYQ